ncbi:MAG: hypothetical protein KatS3mg102_1846 [Planctomycetota bacterium]|nr:MAG: hypothetical protein KatS3mg102_1846 [Planctomycetota bacterium]
MAIWGWRTAPFQPACERCWGSPQAGTFSRAEPRDLLLFCPEALPDPAGRRHRRPQHAGPGSRLAWSGNFPVTEVRRGRPRWRRPRAWQRRESWLLGSSCGPCPEGGPRPTARAAPGGGPPRCAAPCHGGAAARGRRTGGRAVLRARSPLLVSPASQAGGRSGVRPSERSASHARGARARRCARRVRAAQAPHPPREPLAVKSSGRATAATEGARRCRVEPGAAERRPGPQPPPAPEPPPHHHPRTEPATAAPGSRAEPPGRAGRARRPTATMREQVG